MVLFFRTWCLGPWRGYLLQLLAGKQGFADHKGQAFDFILSVMCNVMPIVLCFYTCANIMFKTINHFKLFTLYWSQTVIGSNCDSLFQPGLGPVSNSEYWLRLGGLIGLNRLKLILYTQCMKLSAVKGWKSYPPTSLEGWRILNPWYAEEKASGH